MTEQTVDPRATVACPFCGTLNGVRLARAADRPICGECGRPLLLDRPLAATDENFHRIIRGTDVPVLVDFHADWCGPCKIMAPVMDELAREYMGRALVLKVDTDRQQHTAAHYQIRGIPTVILFRHGSEVQRQVGAVPRHVLEAMLGAV